MTRNLRGQNYRRALDEVCPNLVARSRVIIGETGKLTGRDIVGLAKAFTLPVKTTFNFLEYDGILPSGTWERLPEESKQLLRQARDRDENL